ncbi:octopamine receptor 1-like [Bicyclus anynana]|uniref:Octopamine receptor 1-like n=1 Tax=Bicyclus anynana TaxID=110368 RepID=A0A6J1NP97_BICAN|nr:octopamine receptor 1-like [Bicyclus anynana]
MWLQPRGETSTGWWTAGTALLAITSATVFANLAVMVALWRVRRAPSHYPLMSLVMADFLVGVAVLPVAAMRELFVFNLNRIICALWSTLDVLCCTASILSLSVLGWERYSGITAPLARARRAKTARTLSVLVWPVSILVALPDAFIPSPKALNPGELEKACDVNTNIWYVFFSITLSFYVPATMILTQYGFILRALASPPHIRAHRGRTVSPHCQKLKSQQTQHKSSPKLASPSASVKTDTNQNLAVDATPKAPNNSAARIMACTEPTTGKCSYKSNFIERQRRATRMIVMLMALFFVCWTPYFVILPLDALYDIVSDSSWAWCSWLGYVNSALNPFVYAAASPSVRRVLQHSHTSSGQDIPLAQRSHRP